MLTRRQKIPHTARSEIPHTARSKNTLQLARNPFNAPALTPTSIQRSTADPFVAARPVLSFTMTRDTPGRRTWRTLLHVERDTETGKHTAGRVGPYLSAFSAALSMKTGPAGSV